MRRWGVFSSVASIVSVASVLICGVSGVEAAEGIDGDATVKAAAETGPGRRLYPDGSELYRKGPYPQSSASSNSADSAGGAFGQGAIRGPYAPIEPLPLPDEAASVGSGSGVSSASAANYASAVNSAAAIAITLTPAATEVDLYRPLFVSIDMAVDYANPYDQNDVKVDLVAASPSGKTIVQPCFFKSGTPSASVWEARWTPRETGEFTYQVTVLKNGQISSSPAQTLKVNPSGLDGFLHLDTTSYFQFRFDSGKPFRGVGENYGWESGKYTFEVMFDLLKKNGANFVRTWKGPGSFYLEQGSGKAGWYNQDTASRQDQILKLAEESGIYLMPVFDPVIEYQTGVDGWSGEIKWQKNPYGTYKGGPCNGPIDFFNGSKAREIYKNRLRYSVARWGYSPYMGVYEFWNEVDWANITEKVPVADIAAWHDYMGSYLRSIDPYHHLVTTSLSHSDFPELWRLKNMDFTQRHLYGSTEQFISFRDSYSKNYSKPFVSGEFSFDWQGVTQHPHDQYAKELHLGLWRGMFTGTPILPLTWWWDFHADNNDYFHYARAREFMDRMLAGTKGVVNATVESSGNVEARAIKSDRGVFVWLLNKGNAALGSYQVKLSGIPDAPYEWKTFDTWKGGFGNAASATAAGGQLSVSAPGLAAGGDMALWFADKTPVVALARTGLPEDLTAAFEPGTGRLSLGNTSARTETIAFALVDLKGRMLNAGKAEVPANGRTTLVLEAGNRRIGEAGVYGLRLTAGGRSVTRRMVLAPR